MTRPGWIRRLWGQCWEHRGLTVGTMLATLCGALLAIAAPLLTKAAVDAATTGAVHRIAPVAGLLALFGALLWAATYARRMLAGRLALAVQHSLRLGLLGSLQRLDGQGQDRIRTGQVVSRSISDLQQVYGLLAMLPMSLGSLVQFVLALAVMTVLSPLLTLAALLIVPLVAAVVFVVRPQVFAATWSAQQQAGHLAQHVEETVTGVRIVKGFGQEARSVDVLEQHGRALYAHRMRAARINARFTPPLSALPQLGLVGVIALGGYLALHGNVTVGTFLAFSAYVTTMTSTTRQLSSIVITAQLSRAAVERVYEVLDTEPEVADPTTPEALPDGPLGIEFRGVTFGFDADRPVLDGLELRVAPGETVAIVGPAGAGKTALSLLLGRFYAPRTGRIALGGVDVARVRATELREAVALVFDEPFLFSDTVAANIALGKPEATAAEIRAAARLAAADGFIDELPDGYDTVVGERGLTLSGGQRQRIALARALLLAPRVLVLDDATSAIDAVTESAIFDRLRPRLAARGEADHHTPPTTLILAHRRSTLLLADRVAVLDGGRIADIGTLDELESRGALSFDRSLAGPDLWPDSEAPQHSSPLGMAASPKLQATIDALPAATEVPHLDGAALRAPDPDFALRRMIAPIRWLLVALVACLAADSAISVAFPSVVRYAIDNGVVPRAGSAIVAASALGVVLVLVDLAIVAVMTVLTARAGERVLFTLRVRSYAHLQRLGLDYYEREMSGRIMARMTTDIDALSTFIQTGLSTSVVSVLTLVGISVALLSTDLTLGLVALAAVPPLAVATVVFRKVSSSAYTTARERISVVNADFQENIAGLRAAQAYRREAFAAQRFAERADSYRRARLRSQRAIATYFPFVAMLSDLALAAVIFVGAHQVARGDITPGVLVAAVLYLSLLFGPIQQLSSVFDGYQQARVGLRRIGDLLRTPTAVDAREAGIPIAGHLRGAVTFDDVCFRYSDTAAPALCDIDLEIPRGATVALVGKTGAGKSTLVKLIARFYDPTRGAVRADGVDLRDYRLADYRHRLGVVPQEAHLFTGDIASNIAFGKPTATRAEIEAAVQAVGALPVIAALPQGMRTRVGERGQGLSAGQRQLVALARAELVDPDILLLDEATATLDPATERQVLDASRAVTRRRTSIVVAHRLATAAAADLVVVVDHGRIVEKGSHAELVEAGGPYAQLWNASQQTARNKVEVGAVIPELGLQR